MTFSASAAATETATSEYGVLEEVIVTATRREANLMAIPISVTALSGQELEQLGIPDLTYLSQYSPNTTLEPTPGTNTTLTAYIRGVGQQDINAGFETGVGMYLDDVYLNRPQAAILDIYDVERIEVLRGPQGTLFGRNSVGGAIRYITRSLDDQAMLRARFSYGTDNLREAVITASAPLNEQFRIGGSVARLARDGFGKNLYLGSENYNKDSLGIRVSAEWDATDQLFFRLNGDYLEDDSNARQGRRMLVGRLSGAPILADVYDTRAGLNNPIQSVKAGGLSLLARWQVQPGMELKNVLAWRRDKTGSPWDFDSLPLPDFDLSLHFRNEQFSEEIQLLLSGQRWNGVLGFYYLDASAFQIYDVLLATTGAIIGRPGLNANTVGDVSTKAWSVFSDFSVDLSDHWAIEGGIRYTRDQRQSTVQRQSLVGGNSSFFGGTGIPFATTSDFHGEETFSKATPRLSLSWQPNEQQLVYISYSEGFKSGGFDPRGQSTLAPDTDGDGVVSGAEVFEFMKFEPETVNSYELGIKSELLGGRMNSRLAVFWSDYSDVQIPGSVAYDSDGDGILDQFVGTTTNAAAADIKGAEWEGLAILANNLGREQAQLRLSWALGYVDAQFKRFINNAGRDVARIYQFRNTPEWTANSVLSYELPVQLLQRPGRLQFSSSLTYRGATGQFEQPTPELDQRAYTLWDLNVVWSDSGKHWLIGIHAKNLSDTEYIYAGFYAPTLGREGNITAFYGNPRQILGTVQYQFN